MTKRARGLRLAVYDYPLQNSPDESVRLSRDNREEATFIILHPNPKRAGCAFQRFAAIGQICLQAESGQRSACCASEFVEQLSLELCIVDSDAA